MDRMPVWSNRESRFGAPASNSMDRDYTSSGLPMT
jgi:hypothetical protein